MQHKNFAFFATLTLAIVLILAGTYDCLVILHAPFVYKILVKIFPSMVLIGLNTVYVSIYRITLYSFFNFGALMLCLIGDIFLALYDPNIEDIVQSKNVYFILGGAVFLTARLLFCLTFMIKPYQKVSMIYHPIGKLVTCHIFFSLPWIVLGILNMIYKLDLFSICVFIYMLIGFGFPLSYAYLRIGAVDDFILCESHYSAFAAFLGILLFNISDILLFLALFLNSIPFYVNLISINIYWIGLYLLAIAVVRSPEEHIEKGKSLLPANLVGESLTF